ncbi:MAG: ATP-binding cassette domain-containing protein [Candidatus Heimdallarchaeaceae archaeon]
MGLFDRQEDQLDSYSAGMKQKVLVASTLIHEPNLVFLDEPTSHLDPSASILVKEIIRVLSTETKTTFFICTHLTDLAEGLCDLVGILINGRLKAIDSPQNILNKTDTHNLEEAYLEIVGGKIDREQLLDWR